MLEHTVTQDKTKSHSGIKDIDAWFRRRNILLDEVRYFGDVSKVFQNTVDNCEQVTLWDSSYPFSRVMQLEVEHGDFYYDIIQ